MLVLDTSGEPKFAFILFPGKLRVRWFVDLILFLQKDCYEIPTYQVCDEVSEVVTWSIAVRTHSFSKTLLVLLTITHRVAVHIKLIAIRASLFWNETSNTPLISIRVSQAVLQITHRGNRISRDSPTIFDVWLVDVFKATFDRIEESFDGILFDNLYPSQKSK